MRSVLYGVGVYDLPTLLAVVLTLAAVILLAATPVLKIARIDPVKALREDWPANQSGRPAVRWRYL
jgi:hypothetical protein